VARQREEYLGVMTRTGTLAGLALVAVLATGCSETGFQDFFGAGKYSPDETQVQQGNALAVPPDLALRPPADGEQPVEQANQTPVVFDQQQAAQQQPQQAAQQQPQQQVGQPQPLQQQAATRPSTVDELYAQYGISRYRADGTLKSQAELNEELRQKKLEMERAKNPNYGTIFNMGSIWSDG
jgi:hypothetical protein